MILVLPAILSSSAAALAAAPCPSQPVRLVVPIAPRGPKDIAARMIAGNLTERLATQVIVENRAGAGEVIGAEGVSFRTVMNVMRDTCDTLVHGRLLRVRL